MKNRFAAVASNLLLLLSFHTGVFAAEYLDIKLEVIGLRNHSGSINIAVFNKSEGFPNASDSALRRLAIPISDNGRSVTKLSLPEGNYAFAVFHDEDGNGKLNKNFLGIPSEGFGFSKDPKVNLKPPKFDECLVTVNANSGVIFIHIQY